MKRTLPFAALLLLASPVALAGERPGPAARAGVTDDYRIGKEDVLELSVFRYDDLGGAVTVRPDGRVTLDLIGEVVVEGRTVTEITREIRERLCDFLPDPQVTLSVTETRSMKVFVLGRVAAPGVYAVGSNPTLLQALAMAKGFTPWAKRTRLVLVRGATGKRLNVDYDRILAGTQENLTLFPGDTLVVP